MKCNIFRIVINEATHLIIGKICRLPEIEHLEPQHVQLCVLVNILDYRRHKSEVCKNY